MEWGRGTIVHSDSRRFGDRRRAGNAIRQSVWSGGSLIG
ncbi:hypothetical protein AWB68_08349 [Caballeronia choica]|uniref:Uncharacterized protein n=1 Tax=Caballeronia choica TaxID=326476 RepID=A0A158L1M6_9BURK|nr:hypothetical protein AWB68_08349 [Caballeronia choica]